MDRGWHFSESCAVATANRGPQALVKVLERPTNSTAIIDWCDPGSCRYRDQIWRVTRAPRGGTCALSGLIISPGERVYRPRSYRLTPKNAGAMIRAEQIEQGHAIPLVAPATL
ncbi:DUF3331 domain-containing protein [Caballeronia sordidicola]|uniref:DUF3331 domain-containing protein n=1 Tax=Caballeronia sordidicola TaxID=196367 RepID=UPI000A365A6C